MPVWVKLTIFDLECTPVKESIRHGRAPEMRRVNLLLAASLEVRVDFAGLGLIKVYIPETAS